MRRNICSILLAVSIVGVSRATPPELEIEVTSGGTANPACHEVGSTVTVGVVVGASRTPLVGGQFLIEFDPACVQVVSLGAGSDCDIASPYSLLVASSYDNTLGIAFVGVSVPLGNGGVSVGATMACLAFEKIGACAECDFCFDSNNPLNTYLSDFNGQSVAPNFVNGGCSSNVRSPGVITFNCPADVVTNADCDGTTTAVTWDPVAANDDCEGSLSLNCTAIHDGGLPVSHLISAGGVFPEGVTNFFCSATNSCGLSEICQWFVFVDDAVTMDVSLQLSPFMEPNEITRCIEFELYSDCVQVPEIVTVPMTFNLPGSLSGGANEFVKVPRGQYSCITARDPVHTLRSVAIPVCLPNGKLEIVFEGDPLFGGNWLVGGNLDRSPVIDILDFGVLVSQYLTLRDPDITCDQVANPAFKHADINGDGVVDIVELVFVMINFLDQDKDSCCETPMGAGITQIFNSQLIAMGLQNLTVADLNHDGMVSVSDVQALLQGAVPTPPPNKNNWGILSDSNADD